MTKKSKIIFHNSIVYAKTSTALDSFFRKAVDQGWRISILIERTDELLFIIIRLFNSGITFIPVDPELPFSHIQYMIIDSKTDFVISQSKYKHLLSDMNVFYIDQNTQIQDFFYDFHNEKLLAYILYTSGSTGTPKGVQITREALLNFIDGISEIIDFSPGKRIACLTTVSFDIFFLESIMALYKGLTVVLADEDEQLNPKLMAKLIQENDVDMIQMTPSRMQLLLNYDKNLSCLKNVKEIMIGGESFPLSLLLALQGKTTAKIYNMYGPTETTIWSTVSDLTHKDRIDIGRPIKNTTIYIVDENLNILPDGQAGEICIAGKGLAKGYIGRDDLTAEKFIYLPQKLDTRVFMTGDVGRYLPDGDFEYIGRTDNQVKIRGHRIELEEIEIHINRFEGIKQSIVIALETSENDKILEAFYTSENSINPKDIANYLSIKLPSYMIPTTFKRVEDFLQTSNGKIDRKRVLECIEVKANSATPQEAVSDKMTDLQRRVLEVIASNLDIKVSDEVSLDTNFSDAGIDSITFIKVVVAIEDEFDFEFDDEMLLIIAFPTIRSMVEYVESKATENL